MHQLLYESQSIAKEIIRHRRYLHTHAECGLHLPQACAYIKEQLETYGCHAEFLGGGVVCLLGKGPGTLLLRADMDALPQKEESGLPFASSTLACHSCGHDAHAAMLLGAAKLLKLHEDELKGVVKLVFQPGEETLKGALQMINAGVLENPKVDAAMALHMNFGPCGYEAETGMLTYSSVMASADEFQITVHGRSSHGSSPFLGCSALSAAANIIVTVQQLLALEISCDDPSVISFGILESGTASNIIPDKAVIRGSIRAFSHENRERLKSRLVQLAKATADQWKAEAEVSFLNEVGPNINSPDLCKEMLQYCHQITDNIKELPPVKGSEDFAFFGEHIPTFFANVCAGGPDRGYHYTMHHPKAVFDEAALPYGTAVLCNCAINWLSHHS